VVTAIDQMSDSFMLPSGRHHFSPRRSFSAALSSIASASNRFNRERYAMQIGAGRIDHKFNRLIGPSSCRSIFDHRIDAEPCREQADPLSNAGERRFV
jgi:hypothetical protein